MRNWIACENEEPPEGVVVETKIDNSFRDARGYAGPRNIQPLKRRGRLWWTPDGAMYVYYTPTHWRFQTQEER